jgi:hypothetical protein
MISSLIKCGALKVHHWDMLDPYPKASRGRKGFITACNAVVDAVNVFLPKSANKLESLFLLNFYNIG